MQEAELVKPGGRLASTLLLRPRAGRRPAAGAPDAAPPEPARQPSARATVPPRRGRAPAGGPAARGRWAGREDRMGVGRGWRAERAGHRCRLECRLQITNNQNWTLGGHTQGPRRVQACAGPLTFIHVWHVRSFTSRSRCRAPASSAEDDQGGRQGLVLRHNSACRRATTRPVLLLLLPSSFKAHPAPGMLPCRDQWKSRRPERRPGRREEVPGQPRLPPTPRSPRRLQPGEAE